MKMVLPGDNTVGAFPCGGDVGCHSTRPVERSQIGREPSNAMASGSVSRPIIPRHQTI